MDSIAYDNQQGYSLSHLPRDPRRVVSSTFDTQADHIDDDVLWDSDCSGWLSAAQPTTSTAPRIFGSSYLPSVLCERAGAQMVHYYFCILYFVFRFTSWIRSALRATCTCWEKLTRGLPHTKA